MNANRLESHASSGSDLERVDAHRITPDEYEEIPELTDEALARSLVKLDGVPLSNEPGDIVSLRLPSEVLARWRATGPGWQVRLATRVAAIDVT
jgi:uncharacterized protein (DUF4415 family)